MLISTLRRFAGARPFLAALAIVATVLPLRRANAAAPAAPYADSATVAVVRLRVKPLDAEAFAARINSYDSAIGLPSKEIDQVLSDVGHGLGVANGWIAKFNKAGGKAIYADVELTLPSVSARLAVPLEPGADVKALKELLIPKSPTTAPTTDPVTDALDALEMPIVPPGAQGEVMGNVLYIGLPATLDLIKGEAPPRRPELEAALVSCGEAPIAIAISPNEGPRLLALKAMPQLPPALGGGSSVPVIDGLRWISLSAELPPKAAIHVVIQAKDADAAAKLRSVADSGLGALRQEIPGAVGNDKAVADGLNQALDLVAPAVAGVQLKIDLDDAKLQTLARLLAPSMLKARARAQEIQSASNLRQLEIATEMYAQAHEGKLPTNPKKELAEYLGPTAGLLWINPRYPDRPDGYVYFRPADKMSAIPSPSTTPLYYESFGVWTDGFNVAFADGHVEVIKDKAAFKEMLAKAQAGH